MQLTRSALERRVQLFHRAQMAADIQGGEHPSRMPLIPFEISSSQRVPQIIQNKIPAKGQFHAHNIEAKGRPVKALEMLPRQMVETGRRQMTYMRRIGIRIVRAEMRRGHKHTSPRPRHPVYLRHRRHHILHVLNNVRQMNPLESVGLKGPRIMVQIPNNIRLRPGRAVDAQCARLSLAGAAAHVQYGAALRDGARARIHGVVESIARLRT